jgi:hypothetical protein
MGTGVMTVALALLAYELAGDAAGAPATGQKCCGAVRPIASFEHPGSADWKSPGQLLVRNATLER